MEGERCYEVKAREFFDDAVVSGPDQKAFEEKIYAEAQAKRWPRVAEGTGKFEGQVVIVTGAAGGQGEMEAKMIAQQGAKVYMADIEEEGLKRVEAAIIADGGEAVAFPMDVADEGSWQELVKKVVDESGRLDVLVNNAGMCQNGTVLTETRESLNRIMDVDCWGVYNGMALLRTRHHRSGRRHHRQHVLLPRHAFRTPGASSATPWPRPPSWA